MTEHEERDRPERVSQTPLDPSAALDELEQRVIGDRTAADDTGEDEGEELVE